MKETSQPVRVFLMDLLSIVPYYTGHLSQALMQAAGIEVILGSITYSHDDTFFTRAGLRNDPGILNIAHRVPNALAPLRGSLKLLEYLINLAAWTVRFLWRKPDIVHVQFIPLVNHRLPFEKWFLQFARGLGIKVVYTVHNVLPQDTGEDHRASYASIYGLVDWFICHDVSARERLVREFKVCPDRVSVIPHGPFFASERSALAEPVRIGVAGNSCVVLWQGIIRPYKGISFLLKAWKAAQRLGLTGSLVIVGTGEKHLLTAIEREVRSLGLEASVQLIFRFVSVEQLREFYMGADILVYPYSEVTTSGALMTGMSFGKMIVASQLPAFQQVLRHGDDAWLVPYGDVASLASALVRLAGDPELRLRFARRLQEGHSAGPRWTDIAQQTSDSYRAVLSACNQGINESTREGV